MPTNEKPRRRCSGKRQSVVDLRAGGSSHLQHRSMRGKLLFL
jgi:hypothetical protein